MTFQIIAAIAEAHYVSVAPHNPMGPLATAVNVHFAAATANFTILEYHLPDENNAIDWLDEPYWPKDGYLELRPDRPGFGVEVNEEAVSGGDYIHWERRSSKAPDGSTNYIEYGGRRESSWKCPRLAAIEKRARSRPRGSAAPERSWVAALRLLPDISGRRRY